MSKYEDAIDTFLEFLEDQTVPNGGKLGTTFYKDWLAKKANTNQGDEIYKMFAPFYCGRHDCAEGRRIAFDDENIGVGAGECPCNIPIRQAKARLTEMLLAARIKQLDMYMGSRCGCLNCDTLADDHELLTKQLESQKTNGKQL